MLVVGERAGLVASTGSAPRAGRRRLASGTRTRPARRRRAPAPLNASQRGSAGRPDQVRAPAGRAGRRRRTVPRPSVELQLLDQRRSPRRWCTPTRGDVARHQHDPRPAHPGDLGAHLAQPLRRPSGASPRRELPRIRIRRSPARLTDGSRASRLCVSTRPRPRSQSNRPRTDRARRRATCERCSLM